MATNKFTFPAPFLSGLIEKQIIVRLKWGMEYIGTLVSFDSRMNIHLRDAEEYTTIGAESDGTVGDVLIRCNNILHIRPRPDNYPPVSNENDDDPSKKFQILSKDSISQPDEE